MKIGAVTPSELRAVCEKGLLLVTITIPEMEVNFIFSLLINLFHLFIGLIIPFNSLISNFTQFFFFFFYF